MDMVDVHLINDLKQKIEVLIFGYIHNLYNIYGLQFKSLPIEIINLIELFYQPQHSAIFPKHNFSYRGYIDIAYKQYGAWKRRYCVINNNLLLIARTPHSSKLDVVYPLQGSSIKCVENNNNNNDNMTLKLFIRKHRLFFRTISCQECDIWKDHISKASKLKIKDIYRLLYRLDSSQTQIINVFAGKHKKTNQECTIKSIDKRKCELKLLKKEIKLLKQIDNPYIIELYDIFETKKYLYIVMLFGYKLFEQIIGLNEQDFNEEDFCLILHQIAKAVKYMHQIGIVIKDLKPENVLCIDINSIKKVKLVKSTRYTYTHNNNIIISSYTAPEILTGNQYDDSVDLWSIGVIMYVLLCGYLPFYGHTEQQIKHSILNDKVEFNPDDWLHVTQKTKDLCTGLLHKDPTKRSTINDLLNLTFKVSVNNISFKNSQTKFIQTMIERNFMRI